MFNRNKLYAYLEIVLIIGIVIIGCLILKQQNTPQQIEMPNQMEDVFNRDILPYKIRFIERPYSKVDEVIEEINTAIAESPLPIQEVPRREIFISVDSSQGLDRTTPLYNVYKNSCKVEVDTDLQWYIRDMCEQFQFAEKCVYGVILCESCFQNIQAGSYYGLCMISPFWIGNAAIEHFTDDYASRDLLNPYDNLLTLAEMWCYARTAYGLDLTTEDGCMRVCYWHNTGKDPRYISESSYFNLVKSYGEELIALQ